MNVTRRDFVKAASAAAAALTLPAARMKDPAPIRIGLVGCGGRGRGAAMDCMSAAPNIQLVALADLFPDHLGAARKALAEEKHPGYKVDDAHCFTGWDAYKKLIDLKDVDLVLLATPPGFRPIHFAAAIDAGKHVFMEKPIAVDPVGVRKVIETGKKAKEKNLAVLAGTQYRHQEMHVEIVRRIHAGQIGEIRAGRAYYNTITLWSMPHAPEWSDMEWQIRNWYYFDWLSGDFIVEQHVHTLDVTNWVMRAHPVRAVGVGGRQVRTEPVFGHVYDHFAIDYEYPNDVHVMSMCRQMDGCSQSQSAYFVGTKGEALPYKPGYIKGENSYKWPGYTKGDKAYIQEHADLIESIRSGKPINEAEQVAESTLTAILGREAAYTGKTITWDEMMNSDMDLSPPKYEFGPLPVHPVRMPGRT